MLVRARQTSVRALQCRAVGGAQNSGQNGRNDNRFNKRNYGRYSNNRYRADPYKPFYRLTNVSRSWFRTRELEARRELLSEYVEARDILREQIEREDEDVAPNDLLQLALAALTTQDFKTYYFAMRTLSGMSDAGRRVHVGTLLGAATAAKRQLSGLINPKDEAFLKAEQCASEFWSILSKFEMYHPQSMQAKDEALSKLTKVLLSMDKHICLIKYDRESRNQQIKRALIELEMHLALFDRNRARIFIVKPLCQQVMFLCNNLTVDSSIKQSTYNILSQAREKLDPTAIQSAGAKVPHVILSEVLDLAYSIDTLLPRMSRWIQHEREESYQESYQHMGNESAESAQVE